MILERSQHGLVQVLTLNRPEAANSLNPELLGALAKAFHEIATDDATQVIILTGAGERIFCAGMDLRAFSENRIETSIEGRDAGPKQDGADV
jgi:enoyl-CoA hydratase